MFEIKIPAEVRKILAKLHEAGYEAYIVGGCVRDSMLGITPHDWDICTSALPEDAVKILNGYEIIPTGLKHGTITAVDSSVGYEITTFRRDGEYKDSRHPESVEFVSDLKEDLARRDFTVNAMAYSDETGVIDYFGGIEDLKNGIVSCVGRPDDRFAEDALRVMRALRFAAVYNFKFREETACAIHRNKERLKGIAAERVQTELIKMLLGGGALQILLDYSDVMAVIIPELQPCIGFEQNNRHHQYTVYEHIVRSVCSYSGSDVSVKLALLMHDIGKPQCYTEDENGGHFRGHSAVSRELAEQIADRLRLDNKTKSEVLELILYHDYDINPNVRTIKRWLNKIGFNRFGQLMHVQTADISAHAEGTRSDRIQRCIQAAEIAEQIVRDEQCFSVGDLAINGYNILKLGVHGKIVGDVLRHILEKVIDGELDNSIESQIYEAEKYINELNRRK